MHSPELHHSAEAQLHPGVVANSLADPSKHSISQAQTLGLELGVLYMLFWGQRS